MLFSRQYKESGISADIYRRETGVTMESMYRGVAMTSSEAVTFILHRYVPLSLDRTDDIWVREISEALCCVLPDYTLCHLPRSSAVVY